jgi:alpha-ribazole phosphatase
VSRSSSLKTLFLIRHGVADGTEGRCIGQTDVPLSAIGREQCARLSHAWRPPEQSTIWCSDLTRAHDTALLLAAHWSLPSQTFRVDARLRECSFGAWDGRTWDEIQATDPHRLDAWMQEWGTALPPGGESLPLFSARVLVALEDVAASEGSNHVIVAHAGVIRAILCQVTGTPDLAGFSFAVPHAHVTAVTLPGMALSGAARGTLDWLNAFPPPATRGGTDDVR